MEGAEVMDAYLKFCLSSTALLGFLGLLIWVTWPGETIRIISHKLADKPIRKYDKNLIVTVEFVPQRIYRLWQKPWTQEYIGAETTWKTYPGINRAGTSMTLRLSDYYDRVKYRGNWESSETLKRVS